MILRSSADNENCNACRCTRFRPLPLERLCRNRELHGISVILNEVKDLSS
jgi:hypothetical protein